jgi:peptidoglycan/LPS O-acetylase OafA/YrhL
MITQNKRLFTIVISVAVLLLIPLIGMQFSDEVNWSIMDFVIAGSLLLGTGLICEFIMRKVKKKENRITLIIVIIALLLLIWAELAVGVFGTSLAGS